MKRIQMLLNDIFLKIKAAPGITRFQGLLKILTEHLHVSHINGSVRFLFKKCVWGMVDATSRF